jgi:broad specificity phosphatase PhoE
MIYFVRHGRKAKGNYYNETLGFTDEPLSDEGLRDAKRVAEYFSNIDISKIIVSEYQRTYQTALPTAQEKGLPIAVDGRVNEMNIGKLAGMTEEQAEAAFPEFWKKLLEHKEDLQFPGGECGADVLARQDSFLNEMKYEKENIMVVSHDGFIRILLCNILGLLPYMRYKFKTSMAGLSIIDFDTDEGEWRIARFNQAL